jgi:hypothetical protein
MTQRGTKLQTFKKTYEEILINYHSKMKNPLDSPPPGRAKALLASELPV